MTSVLPYRDVMGMRIPLPLVGRIIAAIRAEYPGVVEGLDDDGAMRAVFRMWVTTTLTNFEARMAAESQRQVVAQAQALVDEKANTAFQKAMTDLAQQVTDVPA